jgi:RHS repeat-associated protein
VPSGSFVAAEGVTYAANGLLYVSVNEVYGDAGLISISPSTGTVTNLTGFASGSNTVSGAATDGTYVYFLLHGSPSCCGYGWYIERWNIAAGSVSTWISDAALDSGDLAYLSGYLYTGVNSTTGAGRVLVRRYNTTDGSYTDPAGAANGYQDGTGTDAWFASINGIATDGTNLYVADAGANNRIRKLAPADPLPSNQPGDAASASPINFGSLSTIAGTGTAQSTTGYGINASLNTPHGVAYVNGAVYIGGADAISKIDLATGRVTILGGQPGTQGCTDASTGSGATTQAIRDLTSDGHYLYSTSSCGVRRTSLDNGATSTVYAANTNNPSPQGVAVGPDGNLYVAFDNPYGNVSLLQINPITGASTSVYSDAVASNQLYGVAADATTVYFIEYGNPVCCTTQWWLESYVPATKAHTNIAAIPALAPGSNLEAVGSTLYTAASNGQALITLDKATGAASTLAGGGSAPAGQDGVGGQAGFSAITDVTSDGTRLYVTDAGSDNLLREVSGIQPILAGGGYTLPFNQQAGYDPAGLNQCTTCHGDPIDTATGALVENFTDLAVPGRGLALRWTRSYDSLAAHAGQTSPLGPGWVGSYQSKIIIDPYYGSGPLASSPAVDVVQEDGARVAFQRNGDGTYSTATRELATLVQNADGTWTFTRRARTTFRFNPSGQLTAITDPNGYTTSLSYSGGQLTTVTDPANRSLIFTYTNGNLTSVADSSGRHVDYSYDTNGNLATVRDAAGNTTSYAYDTNHLISTVTEPNSGIIRNSYDRSGRVISQTDPAGRQTTYRYSPLIGPGSLTVTITDPRGIVSTETYTNGELTNRTDAVGTSSQTSWAYGYDSTTDGLTSVTDPLNHTWTYSYDAAGNQTSACDPLNHCTTRTFNTLDEPTSVTDPNQVTTTNSYDSAGNLLSTSTPLTGTNQTATTTLHYDDLAHPGDVTAATDPRGKTTQFGYDTYGQRTQVIDPTGDKTSYSYTCTPAGPGCRSNVGWVYASVAPRGNVTGGNPAQFTTSYTRDDDGRVLSVTDPLGHTTSYTYDPNGNRASVTDPNSYTTNYSYNADDELTTVTRPDTTTLTTGYDSDGNVTSQTDGAGNITSYSYDPLNHVTSVMSPPTATNPNGITTSYSYDTAGRLTTSVNAANQTTSYGYDTANRLTSISYSDGVTPNVSYGYDPDNRRTSMSDGTGTTSYSYDSLGRVTDVTDGAGHHVGYGYDLAGNATTINYPNGQTVTRGFDDAARLASVTDANQHTTTFGYNPDGALTSTSYPNGVVETTTVDNADQAAGITDTGLVPDSVSSASSVSFGYTRDPAGQLTATTATNIPGQASDTYGYSSLNQLTSYTPSSAGAYGYDHADNLTALADGTSQAFDPANEITSATLGGATTTFGYNPRGDRTSATSAAGTVSYGYDQADRLTSYTSPGGATTVSYTYNGDGLRTAKTVNGTNSTFAWDSVTAGVPLLLSDGTTSYLYGPGGLPIEQTTPTPTISRVATGTALDSTGTATSLQANFSAAAQPGDQILLAVNSVAGDDPTTPTGYTQVGSYPAPNAGETTTVYRRTAIGGEITATVSFTGALAHAKTLLAVVYRGVDPVHPIETTSSAGTSTPTATSVGVPGVTTTRAGAQLVLLESAANSVLAGSWTPPAGMTDRADANAATIGSQVADQPFPIPGPTGDQTATFSQPGQLEGVLLVLQRAPNTYYLTHDQQDSTRLVTDPVGHVAGSYSYDPYGRTLNHSGPTSSALLYDGQYQDGETGLYYLRARYYDPSTAQFLTRDPVASLTGLPYTYASENPLGEGDPLGLFGFSSITHFVEKHADIITTTLDLGSAVLATGALIADATGVGAPVGVLLGGASAGLAVGGAAMHCIYGTGRACAVAVAAAAISVASAGLASPLAEAAADGEGVGRLTYRAIQVGADGSAAGVGWTTSLYGSGETGDHSGQCPGAPSTHQGRVMFA